MKAIKIDLTNLSKLLPISKRGISRLFVHCTAGWPNESNEALFKGFKDRGWKNPGYHVTVDADGTAWLLQPVDLVANGVAGYNSNSLHISYKGGIVKAIKRLAASDTRTEAQKETLLLILKHWKKQYPKAHILGHRDISPDTNLNGKIDFWERIKECPCFDAIPEYAKV